MSHPTLKRVGSLVLTIAAALVLAACGSSSSSSGGSGSGGGGGGSSAPGVTRHQHHVRDPPAADRARPRPGYSEIAPASQAFFDYVNAHGGVFGRKIHLVIKDDAYNPANTVNVVHQLVLQNNVFGIFEGLGTPTHTKVVGFLNASKVPDMFVASGCPCWDNGRHPALHVRLAAQLHDRGQDPRPVHQAALRRPEGRRALPGRRLRPGRPGRDPGRASGVADRGQAGLPVRRRPRWRRR